jgi:hypothetical protein
MDGLISPREREYKVHPLCRLCGFHHNRGRFGIY